MRNHLEGFIRRSGRKKVWVKHWQTLVYIYGKTKSNPLSVSNSIQQGKAESISPSPSSRQWGH